MRVQSLGCRMKGVGCRVKGVGCRVKGLGCRVKGVGCRVHPRYASWRDVAASETRAVRRRATSLCMVYG